jgi:hypothetical protein
VLEDETGVRTVLVTSDLLGFIKELSDPISARVLAKYGIPRERLALNASHTHSGPVIGRMLRPAYPLTPQHEAVIDRYTAHLKDLVVEVIGAAVGNLAPADVSFSQGLAGFAVNRRRVMLRNLAGPVDHDVPVLSVRSPDGALRVVVFGYACHNTVLADDVISGDYAGFAQQALGSRATQDGVLIITSRVHRTQEANRAEARARLNELIARAEVVPKTRRPSRPTLASKVRRLTAKSQRSSSKKLRGRTSDD